MAPKPGFRLGISVFTDVKLVDCAAPYVVFSVARRLAPSFGPFLVAERLKPEQTRDGFTLLPNYGFANLPAMNALLIPGGLATRQETGKCNLYRVIPQRPYRTLLTRVCTGKRISGQMGLRNGLLAIFRKEPDRLGSRLWVDGHLTGARSDQRAV